MRAVTKDTPPEDAAPEGPGNFIDELVDAELAAGTIERIVTRFPPEPNGYLHIGHAKSIALNFTLGQKTAGSRCHLRFDDTNPEAEDVEFVESIQNDIRWLGFDWGEHLHFASDYFDQLYAWAVALVKEGKAYVDTQSTEAIRAGRGDFYKPGVESPYRERPVEENLALLEKMRAGEMEEGEAVLRAKIDMQSKDLKLRDPLMYRIRKVPHHRTGTKWSIYPMYDWAHGQSDAIEGITHSICTLEFQNHRGLYQWFLEAVGAPEPRPRQIEFARLNLTYTVMSKRKLQTLVRSGHVSGWDDPRMPTVAGMRRAGYTPEAIRNFCKRVGVAKRDNVVDVSLLEHALREDLNRTSSRVMGVIRPLELVIDNWDAGRVEEVELMNHPEYPERGTRRVPFGGRLFVERDDFMEEAPKKWHRLAPGAEVRLRGACLVRCTGVDRDDAGDVVRLHCTWDPESLGGQAPDGRKVRGTLHWVSAEHAAPAEVRLYDRLFTVENPGADPDVDFLTQLNPASLEVLEGCKLEPSLVDAKAGSRFQLERLGYFCVDPDSAGGRLVLNRTITLRDTWARIAKKG